MSSLWWQLCKKLLLDPFYIGDKSFISGEGPRFSLLSYHFFSLWGGRRVLEWGGFVSWFYFLHMFTCLFYFFIFLDYQFFNFSANFFLSSLSLSYLSFSFPRQFFHKMHSFFNSVLVILVVEFLSLLFPWPDLS